MCQGSADTASDERRCESVEPRTVEKPEEEYVSVRNTNEDASGSNTANDDKTVQEGRANSGGNQELNRGLGQDHGEGRTPQEPEGMRQLAEDYLRAGCDELLRSLTNKALLTAAGNKHSLLSHSLSSLSFFFCLF